MRRPSTHQPAPTRVTAQDATGAGSRAKHELPGILVDGDRGLSNLPVMGPEIVGGKCSKSLHLGSFCSGFNNDRIFMSIPSKGEYL